MSKANSFDGDVYTGVWTDWTQGRIQGSTLTLTRQSGALLIAFLAIFVGAAGRGYWKIVRYLLHLALAKETSVDGVYHQRQAVLRNTGLAMDAGLDLLYMRLAWRNRTNKADKKLTSIAALAFLSAGAFIIAGIFSSRVTGGSNDFVLLSGSHCGNISSVFFGDTLAEAVAGTQFNNEQTQLASQYLAYAYQCYPLNLSSETPSECKTYVQSALPYNKNANASCPFDSEMCVLPQGNIEFDSGFLDSYYHLGLNSGPRYQMRLQRQCAPIVTEGYKTYNTTKSSSSNTTQTWVQYNYGGSASSSDVTSWKGFTSRNFTWRLQPQQNSDLLDYEDFKLGENYDITYPATWFPIDPLNKTGGIVTLLFLQSGNVKNVAEVTDPWFSATEARPVPEWTGLHLPNNSYYIAQDTAKVMGCSSKMQFCNPDLPEGRNCWDRSANNGTWNGIWPNLADRIIMNTQFQYFTYMFMGTIETPEGYYVTSGLPALRTRFTLDGVVQPSVIPSDRWQTELEYIFQTDLAAIQARVVELASGSQAGSNEFVLGCGSNVECTRVCQSQKVKSPGYYSFSMLGICIILVFGAVIVLMGYLIETLVDLAARLPFLANNRRFQYARLEWQCNSTFELQRLAQESMGVGTWSHGVFSVPVTERGEKLATLDISNAENPRLHANNDIRGNGYGGYDEGVIRKTASHQVVHPVDDGGYERVPIKE